MPEITTRIQISCYCDIQKDAVISEINALGILEEHNTEDWRSSDDDDLANLLDAGVRPEIHTFIDLPGQDETLIKKFEQIALGSEATLAFSHKGRTDIRKLTPSIVITRTTEKEIVTTWESGEEEVRLREV